MVSQKRHKAVRLINKIKRIVENAGGYFSYLRYSGKYRYVLLSVGIGDIVWFCAFFSSYKNKYGVKNLRIISLPQFVDIVKFYIPDEEIICIGKKKYDRLLPFAKSFFFRKVTYGQFDDYDVRITSRGSNLVQNKMLFLQNSKLLLERAGIEMDEIYKYGYFNLEKNDRPQEMCVSQEIKIKSLEYMDQNGIGGDYAFIIPSANSRTTLPIFFWDRIITELNDRGYKVFLNGDAWSGDSICSCILPPLSYIPIIGREAKIVVGARCGLMDLLYASKANVVVVHNIDLKELSEYQHLAGKYESFEEIEGRCGFGNRIVFDARVDASKGEYVDSAKAISDIIIEKMETR